MKHLVCRVLNCFNYSKFDTTIWEGASLNLSAYNNNVICFWQDGSTEPQFKVSCAGTYFAIAAIGNCRSSDTINIKTSSLPGFILGEDKYLCTGQSITLNPVVNSIKLFFFTAAPHDNVSCMLHFVIIFHLLPSQKITLINISKMRIRVDKSDKSIDVKRSIMFFISAFSTNHPKQNDFEKDNLKCL